MSFTIVDIGANLANKAFEDDYEAVIDRALDSSVKKIIITASSLDSSKKASLLAAAKPGVLYSTAGVHPHDAKSANEHTLPDLRSLFREKHVVAAGECGLDFNRNYSDPKVQEKWLAAQVELACEIGKPLFLHEREAHVRFMEILLSFRSVLPPAVVHCFTGTRSELFDYLDKGFYIGITGWICDERRGGELKEIASEIPIDRLMIETDAPYLIPRTMHPKPRNSRNEPAFLRYVLEAIAATKNKSIDEIASATYENSERFFGL